MSKMVTYIAKKENSLLNSILFLIFGIILFTNPGGIMKFVSYILGTIVIIIGICNILSYYKTLKKLNIEETGRKISGIIIIVFGIVIMIFSSFIETVFRLICGGWIIYNGLIKFIASFAHKTNKKVFIVSMAISIITILCGFYVALTTALVFKFIGLFIMIYAILDIVSYTNIKIFEK